MPDHSCHLLIFLFSDYLELVTIMPELLVQMLPVQAHLEEVVHHLVLEVHHQQVHLVLEVQEVHQVQEVHLLLGVHHLLLGVHHLQVREVQVAHQAQQVQKVQGVRQVQEVQLKGKLKALENLTAELWRLPTIHKASH